MTNSKRDLVRYRMGRAHETFEDALLLAENGKWNSTINRLYYAAFYAVSALIIVSNKNTHTHNGVKIIFSEAYIKTGLISKEQGRIYSQLFMWRQKGDYDDLFNFDRETVFPYIEKVERLIFEVEKLIG